jgi:hypothetical protein
MKERTKGFLTIFSGFFAILICGTVNCWGFYVGYIASWLREKDSMATYYNMIAI